jgi:hypothetical protein
MKIRPVEAVLFHANVRTDVTELIVAVRKLRTRVETSCVIFVVYCYSRWI